MNFRGEMKYGAEVALSVYDQFQESAKLYGKMIILGRFFFSFFFFLFFLFFPFFFFFFSLCSLL